VHGLTRTSSVVSRPLLIISNVTPTRVITWTAHELGRLHRRVTDPLESHLSASYIDQLRAINVLKLVTHYVAHIRREIHKVRARSILRRPITRVWLTSPTRGYTPSRCTHLPLRSVVRLIALSVSNLIQRNTSSLSAGVPLRRQNGVGTASPPEATRQRVNRIRTPCHRLNTWRTANAYCFRDTAVQECRHP